MLREQIVVNTPDYWTTAFRITRQDLDFLYSLFLDREVPLTSRELALSLVEQRLKQEEDRFHKQFERSLIFQPKGSYEVGQELLFPALDYLVGTVVSTRVGNNPDYGDFTVLNVEFPNRQHKEFASQLSASHTLNMAEDSVARLPSPPMPTAETIVQQYGEIIIEEIEAKLVDEEDIISFADRWFLQSLMVDVNIGHLHLAEAMLDINEGMPLTSAQIINDIDLAPEAPDLVREFSLNVALSNDERFDDVGATGQIQWVLRRFEPTEVQETPLRLIYTPINYNRELLTDEMRAIEAEIDDEWSDFEVPSEAPEQARLSLNYAHRRTGTLPLTSKVRAMFPIANESLRIRITFVDSVSGNEFAGWIVHEDRYVYGLADFYSTHRLPIGGFITIQRTDDPSKLILHFNHHRPHSEYIPLAEPNNNRLTFSNFKRAIGAEYDDLLVVGAEDIKGVDALWKLAQDRRRTLVDIMREVIPELAKLNPQNGVHLKTLYSAVNILKRCPPGPIFATLVERSEFEHIAGPYWRLASSSRA